MAKRRMGTIALLLCLCMVLLPCTAFAASTADAKEPISPESVSSLAVKYSSSGIDFEGLEVKLYKIADVSADFQYTLTPTFADSGLIVNGIQTAGEWKVIRTTLSSFILANSVAPESTLLTDEEGIALFSDLPTGLYLAVSENGEKDGYIYAFESALVSLPSLNDSGFWEYDVAVNAKPEVIPPIEGDDLGYKVIKLWKGDSGANDRPKSIEIEIYRDGELFTIVALSEENLWMYSWDAEQDGAVWQVCERNVPIGYTMTLEQREATFVVTNTRNETPPDPPPPPQTGDSFNILWYIIIMYVSGTVLVLLGNKKRKRTSL